MVTKNDEDRITRFREVSKADWKRTTILTALFVVLLTIGAFVLLPTYWYIWLLLIAGGSILLVSWHTEQFGYQCPDCGNEFEISALTNFISPHGVSKGRGWKYLKCPHCRQRVKAVVMKK